MKIPAIRATLGDRTFYQAVLTFQQVSDLVVRMDEDLLFHSEGLKDIVQRQLVTENYESIKEYILNQSEMFFNSLVLAVYDTYPDWEQLEIKLDGSTHRQYGFLQFPGPHMVFPVDGQHRVEGIKEALKLNPELADEQISALIIGHKDDQKGKVRTRRIFTTLNRYAKAVSLRDIIALDEDDIVAITTRELLYEHQLFIGNRIIDIKNKAIPATNVAALTSIITLYQTNYEIFKFYFVSELGEMASKKKIDDFLRFRKTNEVNEAFLSYCIEFWHDFESQFSVIQEYLALADNPAENFRHNEGGNLIFRPVGFLPLIRAVIEVRSRTDHSFQQIMQWYNQINFELNASPWQYVMWDPIQNRMVMNGAPLTYQLLLYMYPDYQMTEDELNKLQKGYAAKLGIVNPVLDDVLNGIR